MSIVSDIETSTQRLVEHEKFVRRLVAAVLWADHYTRIGSTDAARDERRSAAWLANCIDREDYRSATPPDIFYSDL